MQPPQQKPADPSPWARVNPSAGFPIILGNRGGLTAIKHCIDRALVSDADAAIFEDNRIQISHIQVLDKDPGTNQRPKPGRKKEAKEAVTLLILAMICVAVAMVFGFGVIYLWKLSHGTLH